MIWNECDPAQNWLLKWKEWVIVSCFRENNRGMGHGERDRSCTWSKFHQKYQKMAVAGADAGAPAVRAMVALATGLGAAVVLASAVERPRGSG